MRQVLPLLGAFACAAAALGAMPAVAQSMTTNQTMDDCKLIPDDSARLACYDRVIKAGRENVAGSPASSSAPQSANSGGSAGGSGGAGGAGSGSAGGAGSNVAQGTGTVTKQMTPEERREANEKAFGVPGYERSKVESKQEKNEREIENVKEITAQVASVDVTGPNMLRVTTTDGQVWDQIEGPGERAKTGDTILIKRNFMGGLMCKINKRAPYRCIRADRPGQS